MALRSVGLHRGTAYPCTADELHDAVTPNLQPRRNSDMVSANQASRDIQRRNEQGRDLSNGEYDAIRRLEGMILNVRTGRVHWTPDIIIKAFCDLDRVFFLGKLRGHVHVEWKTESSFRSDRHHIEYGLTVPLGGGKAVIHLNADTIFGSTRMSAFNEMFRTMLHEMW